MKKLIIFTLILTLAISTPVLAKPQYSANTQKLMQESGIEYNVPVDEVMKRQEDYKKNKANKTTATQNTVPKSANNPYNEPEEKSGFDELRINENYIQDIWQPDYPVVRLKGFDEIHLPNEL